MLNSHPYEICFEYPINSDVVIDYLSYKDFHLFSITPEELVIKDVPYKSKDDKQEDAKISITIKRDSLLTEDQLMSILNKAQLPIEEFDVFLRITTTVDKTKITYKK